MLAYSVQSIFGFIYICERGCMCVLNCEAKCILDCVLAKKVWEAMASGDTSITSLWLPHCLPAVPPSKYRTITPAPTSSSNHKGPKGKWGCGALFSSVRKGN